MNPKWIIFLAVLTYWMGLAVINPLMGPIARSMGLTELQSGWLISITAIMSIVGGMYLGRKSDTLGRKKVLLMGMIGLTIAMFIFAILVTLGLSHFASFGVIFFLMLLVRLIKGLFAGAVPTTGQAYMADITTEKERLSAMSLIGSANGLGFVLGPMLGALTAGFHMAAPFFITSIIAAGMTIWILISLPDKKPPNNTQEVQKTSEPKPIRFSRVWLPLVCCLLLTLVLNMVQVTTGFFVQDTFHFSIDQATRYVTMMITVAGLTVVFTQILIVNRVRWSPTTLIRTGLPIVCLGFLLLSTTHQMLYFSISFLLIGLGTGMALPGAVSSASLLVDQTQQGKIAGLVTSFNAAGAIIAPLLGTFLYQLSPGIPYYTCMSLIFVAALLILTIGKKTLAPINS